MNAFDKVIGYKTIKDELLQICDMFHNREVYEKLGAKLPQGVILYGDPGLGKTLMAESFIEESGLETYTIRRNKGNDDFVGEITDTFRKAKENAPCIVFLDDMDKFANEDNYYRDTEEYVAVQSGIDVVEDFDVFVLATANDIDKLPTSLLRPGRFDKRIRVNTPTGQDTREIVEYYLSDKEVAQDVNIDDLVNMMSYNSCAELETILNEAAVYAANQRKHAIGMNDIVNAVLRMEYDAPDKSVRVDDRDLARIALHEAGHVVVAETLCTESVGLATIRSTGRDRSGGFVHLCKELGVIEEQVLMSLAGKAAVELYQSGGAAIGCSSDLKRAMKLVRDGMGINATCGLGMLSIGDMRYDISGNFLDRSEAVAYSELERFMFITRNILIKNRDFLEIVRDELIEKETLLSSDIKRIEEELSEHVILSGEDAVKWW